MSVIEREIIEKFHRLQPDAKQRVLASLEQEVASEVIQADSPGFDYDAWFRNIEMLRQQISASQGDKLPPIDVVGMLRDIREGEDE